MLLADPVVCLQPANWVTVGFVGGLFRFISFRCILFTILRGSFLFQALCFPDSIVEWVKIFELWFGGF